MMVDVINDVDDNYRHRMDDVNKSSNNYSTIATNIVITKW